MRISAKAEYACLAVLELARRYDQAEPVRASDIADANQIPQRFLVQILLQLKGAGFVISTRGASGGYRLAEEPAKINLWDIIETIDGPMEGSHADQAGGQSVGWKVFRRVWEEVARAEQEQLQQIDFAQLVEQSHSNAPMYYI